MNRKRAFSGLSPSLTNGIKPAETEVIHVSLEAVRVFEAAARHLGFSAAADELGVTQSAVSQRVRNLEAMLGIALFARLPHGLRLTEAGQNYLLDVRPALQRLRAASGRIAARQTRRRSSGPQMLSVGTTPSISISCLIPHLADFQRKFPEVALRIEWLAAFGVDSSQHLEVLSVTDSALAQQAAANGLGVALGRSRLVNGMLETGQLIRPVRDSIPSPFSYFFVRQSNRGTDPLLGRFEEWLRSTAFA